MTHHSVSSRIAAILLVSSSLFASANAHADAPVCQADTDCAHGLTCQVTGANTCPDYPACAGTNCPTNPPCTSTEIKQCLPGPCVHDADCADGMACVASTSTLCSGGAPACAVGAKCPPPTPDVCTTQTTSTCTPRYLIACQTATDCGTAVAGSKMKTTGALTPFSCVPDAPECSCGAIGTTMGVATEAGVTAAVDGGAGSNSASTMSSPPANTGTPQLSLPSPPEDAGAATPVPDMIAPDPTATPDASDCSCNSSGQSSCQVQDFVCTEDAECPVGWSCALPAVAKCGTASAPSPAPGVDAGLSNVAISIPCSDANVAAPVGECLPPGYYSSTTAPTLSAGAGTSSPTSAGTGSVTSGGPSGGNSTGSGTPSRTATSGGTQSNSPSDSAAATPPAASGDGCAFAPNRRSTDWGSLFAFASIFGFVLARRRDARGVKAQTR